MTVVNRRTFIAKRGHLDQMIAMMKEEDTSYIKRVYRAHYGPFDTAAMEMEFSSVAEMEQAWNDWSNSDHGREFLTRWWAITESGGTNEVWVLE